jgi:predicted Zn-dependent protease
MEWYRKTTWSKEDERDFRARLKRARSHKRPQYLRVQAVHLLEAGMPEPALQLLDEVLETAPEDTFVTWIHEHRAQTLIDLGRANEAISAYRAALESQRARPNVVGQAALSFAELVVAIKRQDLFDEVLKALEQSHSESPFPAIQYREGAVRALIADLQGDERTARSEAQRALEVAAISEAPFRRHPGLGLVRGVDPLVHTQLLKLAGL